MNPIIFQIYVEKNGDRWCVWESTIPGLFLETDDWEEMHVCIEEIAPELIVHNSDVQKSELSNVQIHVFCKEKSACKSAKLNKPTILLEPHVAVDFRG